MIASIAREYLATIDAIQHARGDVMDIACFSLIVFCAICMLAFIGKTIYEIWLDI